MTFSNIVPQVLRRNVTLEQIAICSCRRGLRKAAFIVPWIISEFSVESETVPLVMLCGKDCYD